MYREYVTGNVMYTNHFHDFYYLEAMRAGLSMAKSTNPSMAFRRSVEKLTDDVEDAFVTLSERMAKHVWIYLWGACLGESVYAHRMCDNALDVVTENEWNYANTFDYYPSDENAQMVIDVFSQRWSSSSFGGKAWAMIANAVTLYGKIPHAAFIDHAVDLEHNSGCVFDKTNARPFFLDCFRHDDDLHGFLDAKFSDNILTAGRDDEVSTKVYRLLGRYNNVVEKISAADSCLPVLEWLEEFDVEWNDGAFENTLSWVDSDGGETCSRCGKHIGGDEIIWVSCEAHCDECAVSCERCGEYVCKDDTTYIDGEDETWCDDCAQSYSSDCEECGKTFHEDNTTTTEDDSNLCDYCAKEYTCEHCGEIHYTNLAEHVEEEHAEEIEEAKQEECRKRNGIRQLELPLHTEEWAQLYKITYYWDTAYTNPVECFINGTISMVLAQIETFKLAGAIVTNYQKAEA